MNTAGMWLAMPPKRHTVQHNILMSQVSVLMNHHQAPLITTI